MFGYIMVNKGELKFKEFELYQSYYCGLCRKLKEHYGMLGQLTLSYDLTFVILLLTALYEPRGKKGTSCCAVHPLRKQVIRVNEFSDYAADMNMLLTYYKCEDDWQDERKWDRLLFGQLLWRRIKKKGISERKKAERIQKYLKELSAKEKEENHDLDEMAGLFGKIMAEIVAAREDEWEEELRTMGFYLGKFIYLCDAYEDIEKDEKKGVYNPLSYLKERPDFEEACEKILTMMAAECSRAFEKLPIIEYTGILRNILYSGIWFRYEKIRKERKGVKNDRSI